MPQRLRRVCFIIEVMKSRVSLLTKRHGIASFQVIENGTSPDETLRFELSCTVTDASFQ